MFQADLRSELRDFDWWTDHPELKLQSSCVQLHILHRLKAGMALLETNKRQKDTYLGKKPSKIPKAHGRDTEKSVVHLNLSFAMHHLRSEQGTNNAKVVGFIPMCAIHLRTGLNDPSNLEYSVTLNSVILIRIIHLAYRQNLFLSCSIALSIIKGYILQ